MDSVERHLLDKSENSTNSSLTSLITSLSTSLVYTDVGNVETNKKLWNAYSADWSAETDWVQTMASHVNMTPEELEFIGDEWSTKEDLKQVRFMHSDMQQRCFFSLLAWLIRKANSIHRLSMITYYRTSMNDQYAER